MKNIYLSLKKIIVDSFKKQNKEINLSFQIRFLDSFKFMQSSLEKLVNTLPTKKLEPSNNFIKNKEKRHLLLRKGAYLYKYVNFFKRLF